MLTDGLRNLVLKVRIGVNDVPTHGHLDNP
jgi:hypothetical protein